MLIVIDGIDGAGKTLQANLLVEALRPRSLNVAEMSFPNYKTETGALIKKMLKQERRLAAFEDYILPAQIRNDEALVLQALMTANRYESFEALREYAHKADSVLVLSRYWASGYAYGTADGLDPDWLLRIHRALPQPDLTVLCDVTVEESFRRRPVREDAYEASRERLERAREGYWQLARVDLQRWLITDPGGTVESIHAQILERVDKLLAGR